MCGPLRGWPDSCPSLPLSPSPPGLVSWNHVLLLLRCCITSASCFCRRNQQRDVGCRLKAFGVRLLAVRRSPWKGEHGAEELLDDRGSWQDLPSLASSADLVILTCVQNELTHGMVNRAFLAACPPGVHIVNVARGAPLGLQ